MANNGIHAFVSGRVQGVFYRDSTRRQAQQLGLTGWVKNIADGRVELKAFGDDAALRALQQWLQDGPPKAEVTDVNTQAIAFEPHESFQIIRK